MRCGCPILVVASLSLTASLARADDAACIHSYEQTQLLRRDAKLREARAQAAKCSQDTCPAVLAKDCQKWLTELEQSIPTVVFDVRNAAGAELTKVAITVDGKPLVDHLDGSAIPIDVGPHSLRFDDGKGASSTMDTVVHEGERHRTIAVRLAGPAAAATRPIPAGVWIFGGVAIAGLAGGTVFALLGKAKESDLDSCKPACSSGALDGASRMYAASDILLAAGVVATLAAAYVFLSRPTLTSASTR